jgi:hypothetical protein
MLGLGAEACLPAGGHELVMVVRGDVPSQPHPWFIPELDEADRPVPARQPVVLGHDFPMYSNAPEMWRRIAAFQARAAEPTVQPETSRA